MGAYSHTKICSSGKWHAPVGSNGTVKLADFGLSSSVTSEELNKSHAAGAVRWKAPEILRGEGATQQTDVYSLAMCVVEAVTLGYPWGTGVDDTQVKHFVLRGHMMPRPVNSGSGDALFTDAQWELVCGMCCLDPSERLSLDVVVESVRGFAKDESMVEWPTEPESEDGGVGDLKQLSLNGDGGSTYASGSDYTLEMSAASMSSSGRSRGLSMSDENQFAYSA